MIKELISTAPIIVKNSSNIKPEVYFYIVKEEDFKSEKISFIPEFLKLNYKTISENSIFFFKKDEHNIPLFIAKLKEINVTQLRRLGASISCVLKKEKFSSLKIVDFANLENKKIEIVRGIIDKCYEFSKYLTPKENSKKLKEIMVSEKISQEWVKKLNSEIESIYLIRDLVNEPANAVFPESVELLVRDLFKDDKNVNLKIFKFEDLKKINANLLMAVGMGFDNDAKKPRMITIEYKGNKEKEECDLALIGKGVTFDSGGYSLKPANSMETMKGDMAGSANVIGIINYASKNNLKVNITGTIALTENMINGEATKPGDIVRAMNGKTVEILNTDAEGRLILADAIYYTSKEYKPKYLLDFATLTGAIVVALGTERAGLFSNNKEFTKEVIQSSEEVNEKVWEMPLGEDYSEVMKSKIADLRNISSSRREAGSCTAAAFLENFTNEHKNWMHLDIAGVSDYESDHKLYGLGASAWGLRLIIRFIEKNLIK